MMNQTELVPGLVNIQKAIENGPVEIVDLPSYKMVDLSIVTLVYQRVYVLRNSDSFKQQSDLRQLGRTLQVVSG
jgi:hypothetical protein